MINWKKACFEMIASLIKYINSVGVIVSSWLLSYNIQVVPYYIGKHAYA